MQRAILLFLVTAVFIGIVLSAWAIWRDGEADIVTEETGIEAPSEVGTFSIFTSGEHGFMLTYPETATVTSGFEAEYHVGTAWRAQALPQGSGTPIVSFIVTDITNEASYPRYYTAQVRVGVSNDPLELRQCEEVQQEQGEVKLADTSINGISFKTFSFADAGMMQYVKGVSYRTLREGTCYAVERIAAGSSYRETPSEEDVTDEELESYFEALLPIVMSFRFVDQTGT